MHICHTQGRILEVGSATGQYTLGLARRGYRILGVDFAENLVAVARDRVSDAGLADVIEFQVADARCLEGIPENEFEAVLLMGPLYHLEAVLLMGPLYHLIVRDDRLATLRRAFACLKNNDVLFSSLISRFGIFGDLLKKAPEWIENQDEVWSIVEQGYRPESMPSSLLKKCIYAKMTVVFPCGLVL